MDLNHILYHLGEDRSHYFNAVSPPVMQTSNFVLNDIAHMRAAFSDELQSNIYTRGNNPTVAILRQKLAALEGAEDALVFGSGVAAIAAAIMANIKSGDHIVCVRSPYSWTNFLLTKYLPRFGVTASFVDGTDIRNIEAAIQPNTSILYLESPNTLVFELQDLNACAQLAKSRGIVTVIDNSYCSPIFQKPIDLGIDIVVHSGTKYLNGHSDVVCGVLCSSREMVKKIFESEFMAIGAIIGPHDAALIIRGLRTLPLRLEQSDSSAAKIVAWLEQHPKIEKVHYPFSPRHPQYDLAKRQMQGCGGLFSVEINANTLADAERFVESLERFLIAVSWGGHESLIMPTCGFYKVPGRPDPALPFTFVRFYIGLEDPDWLMEDIDQALGKI